MQEHYAIWQDWSELQPMKVAGCILWVAAIMEFLIFLNTLAVLARVIWIIGAFLGHIDINIIFLTCFYHGRTTVFLVTGIDTLYFVIVLGLVPCASLGFSGCFS